MPSDRMVSRADVVAAARKWIGCRFRHQGRSRSGIDCIGLLVVVARALGLSDADALGYGRIPDGRELRAAMRAHLKAIPPGEIRAGDILLMTWATEPSHTAFVAGGADSGLTIIHAHAGAPRPAVLPPESAFAAEWAADAGRPAGLRSGGWCVEHRLDASWRARIVAAYSIPGVV